MIYYKTHGSVTRAMAIIPMLRRLIALYVCALAAVVVPLPYAWKTGALICVAWKTVRHPAPVVLSATCMFVAECVAVRQSRTWKYDEPNAALRVPLWLYPLWILAAQFCADAFDLHARC